MSGEDPPFQMRSGESNGHSLAAAPSDVLLAGRAMWHAARSGSRLDWDELLNHHRQLLDRFIAKAKEAASKGHTI